MHRKFEKMQHLKEKLFSDQKPKRTKEKPLSIGICGRENEIRRE